MNKQSIYIRHEDIKKPEKSHYEKLNIDGGFIIGHIKDAGTLKLVLELIGEIKFDDAVDDIMSAVYHMCVITWIENKNSEVSRDEIYKRVVQAFSLIMDKFHPKMKDQRTDIMSDEELRKIEELVKKDVNHKQG
jgi:hypothetical protein